MFTCLDLVPVQEHTIPRPCTVTKTNEGNYTNTSLVNVNTQMFYSQLLILEIVNTRNC